MTIISSGLRRTGARLAAFVALTAVLSAGLVGVSPASAALAGVPIDTAPLVVQVQETSRAAVAIAGTSFDPGYIISDWSFYNANGMTQAQIQSFLDAKCTTNNCIDNLKMTTTARAATNMCPSPYAAATNETFAAIIYKVQRSCGISAKVILVTLQKEQGLLTLQNPSALKLRKAMGMGCPDTSVCDSKYYGFFNQVYYAASQLKRYGLRTSDNISFRTKYQIGIPYATSYHPSASCGTKSVTVKTKATTALYYYTPYTPNAKALANLSGTGDKCSSYGNRNFWVYYNSWFGSSLAGRGNDAITAEYGKLGGAGGSLGAEGAAPNCATSSTCSQKFDHGVIYWTLKGGALSVAGAAGDYYLAAGGVTGALGAPTSSNNPVLSPTTGDGFGQNFANGQVLSSSAGVFYVSGVMKAAHATAGWVRGSLGWPTSDQTCDAKGNCSQAFQNGSLYAAKGRAAFALDNGPIGTAYAAQGGISGALGAPISVIGVLDGPNGSGFGQNFTNGQLLSSAAGTFTVSGAFKVAHSAVKWVRGPIGWPVAEKVCDASGNCTQAFQTGFISVMKGKTGYAVDSGVVGAAYLASGGLTSPLGAPISNASAIVGANGNGTGQSFVNGQMLSSKSGTFAVLGAIKTAHASAGWVRGKLGWPTADQVCSGATCTQTFQKGSVTSSASGTKITLK